MLFPDEPKCARRRRESTIFEKPILRGKMALNGNVHGVEARARFPKNLRTKTSAALKNLTRVGGMRRGHRRGFRQLLELELHRSGIDSINHNGSVTALLAKANGAAKSRTPAADQRPLPKSSANSSGTLNARRRFLDDSFTI